MRVHKYQINDKIMALRSYHDFVCGSILKIKLDNGIWKYWIKNYDGRMKWIDSTYGTIILPYDSSIAEEAKKCVSYISEHKTKIRNHEELLDKMFSEK